MGGSALLDVAVDFSVTASRNDDAAVGVGHQTHRVDVAVIGVNHLPVGGSSQLSIGGMVGRSLPASTNDVVDLAVSNSHRILQAGDVALGLDVDRELRTGANHTVAKQVGNVLSVFTGGTQHGNHRINNDLEAVVEADLGVGNTDTATTPFQVAGRSNAGRAEEGQLTLRLRLSCNLEVDHDGLQLLSALTKQILGVNHVLQREHVGVVF